MLPPNVVVAHHLLKYMKNKKIIRIIIFTSFLSTQISSYSQSLGSAFNTNNKITKVNNKSIYPYLHEWSEIKTQKLLIKIEQYANKHKEDGNFQDENDKSYKSWNIRNIIHQSSSCLDKALFLNPGESSSPKSLEYSKRLENIGIFFNLKADDFLRPNERVFNHFCSNIIDADLESGYCEEPKNKTIGVDMRLEFSVFNAINMTTRAKELQQYIPVKCALTKTTPEMLETYNAKAQYKILKPFSMQDMQTPQGIKRLNVGEATVILPEALNYNGKAINWKTNIIQHSIE